MTEAKRLLIIDDEPDICEVLKAKFEQLGFLASTACDGAKGLEQVLKTPPDCILLDIRIQIGEDGLTFLRRLRGYRSEDPDLEARVRKIPVIILTAAGSQMRPLFQMEGISDYIEKPFDTEDLKSRILRVVSAPPKATPGG